MFDNEINKNLGIFMVQLQIKDVNGVVTATYYKPVMIRSSIRGNSKLWNLFFWPLNLIGYFDEPPPISKNILFTNQFVESSTKQTSVISIQLQNRFVQVNTIFLRINAYVGIVPYLFNVYPTFTY
uniref:Seipin n=1 Tax=Acrobeloides nanus TaxID=290746 RepID=A0A914DCY8_9BILA